MASVIRTNWEGTFVQIGESPNYRNATENLFSEVIKWTSRVFFRQYNFILKLELYIMKQIYLPKNCKNLSYDVSFKDILCSLHT
jgi:hypothetical protein